MIPCIFSQLSFDLVESWLRKNPDAMGLKKDGESVFRELALFQDYHGLPAFKNVTIPNINLCYNQKNPTSLVYIIIRKRLNFKLIGNIYMVTSLCIGTGRVHGKN